ncbi:MAG: helix-turn-helix transcriptional regulator [Phyllobacteriaceae bacterium]|nr:helix-turn-helix transcriptional regulator [Phyllobacteriaceae bacterium]
MGHSFSERQIADLHAVIRTLQEPVPLAVMRQSLGYRLMELFRADYFASFVFDDAAVADDQAVTINMDTGNIAAYSAHFQFNDPITAPMRRAGRAMHVNDVMEQGALEKTEFFNDFLAVDGLTHGMNFHACLPRSSGGRHLGDLRIWRSRRAGNFDRTDVQMLQLVGELYAERAAERLALPQSGSAIAAHHAAQHGLTGRETEVLAELCHGKTDAQIALALDISTETVRSHLKAMFQKTGCRGRTALVSACLAADLPENGDAPD